MDVELVKERLRTPGACSMRAVVVSFLWSMVLLVNVGDGSIRVPATVKY